MEQQHITASSASKLSWYDELDCIIKTLHIKFNLKTLSNMNGKRGLL